MLHHLANDGGFVALKQAADDQGMETQMLKTCCTAKDC